MTKAIHIGLALGIGIFAMTSSSALAYTPGNGIADTPHNLSNDTLYGTANDAFADSKGRICVFCHHPHNTAPVSAGDATYLPLWNHDLTTQNFTPYSSYDSSTYAIGTGLSDARHRLNAEASIGQPGGVSLLCLSCHDGTVALDAYAGDLSNSGTVLADGSNLDSDGTNALIGGGGDLSNHHPIGFNYQDVADADMEIALTSGSFTGADGPVTIGELLYNGNMECTTCHDVHNSQNSGERFLWQSNDRSQFCLVCHLKGGDAR